MSAKIRPADNAASATINDEAALTLHKHSSRPQPQLFLGFGSVIHRRNEKSDEYGCRAVEQIRLGDFGFDRLVLEFCSGFGSVVWSYLASDVANSRIEWPPRLEERSYAARQLCPRSP